ncbi:collagen binding domain-containing protein, partial [Pimelobacter sp. 30-1]|uniref:MSCRAMM family protein n=1 Tax=Pimelobacter sp. 30-1 TaxID=2004991 RepID=UPI001C043D82
TGCVYGTLDPVRQVTIEKRTRPQGAADRFTFDQTGPTIDGNLPATSTLGDRDTKTYEIAGDASFTERASTGWALTDLACTGDTSGVRIDKDNARFDVGAVGGDVHCTYTNAQGGAIVEKRDADGNALLGGATFRFDKTTGPGGSGGAAPAIVVTDNQAPDVDPTAGRVEVRGLIPGTWTVTETQAPQGYQIDNPNPVAFTVSADDTTPVTVPAFTDTRKLAELLLLKRDSGTSARLPGAVFALYVDPNGDGEHTADEPAVGSSRTTDARGEVRWSGLGRGTYVAVELSAPRGYLLPKDVSHPVTITLADLGTTLTIEVRNKQVPGETGGVDEEKGGGSSGALPDTGSPAVAVPLSLAALGMLLLGGWLLAVRSRVRRDPS